MPRASSLDCKRDATVKQTKIATSNRNTESGRKKNVKS